MKKALVVLLALAVVASGFAQPVADVNVAEFSGNASVTWGVDLDAEKTGFKNETEAKVVVNIFDAAEQSTEGDGIWAELVIKTDALKIVNEGKEGKFDTGDDGIRIDTAKLHFGPAYLGILADNTQIDAFDAPEAIKQFHTTEKVGEERTQGVVFGYDSDLFNVAVDFRSIEAKVKPNFEDFVVAFMAAMAAMTEWDATGQWTDADDEIHTEEPTIEDFVDLGDAVSQYSNDYAIRAKLGLTPIEGLDVNVGFSYGFETEVKGFGANVSYALPVGDFTLTPGLGYSTNLLDDEKGILAIGLLFGFNAGDTGDDPVGLPYFVSADTDKGTSGVSVSTKLDLNDDPMFIPLAVGFYAGDLVENLSAAVLLKTDDVENFGDNFIFKAALSYAAAVGDGTITPRAGVKVVNDASLEATVGAKFAGFVDNTTFDAVWESRNLKADPAGMGTFNVSITIAL